MNVLVDTSVWVAHFKRRDERLVALLEAGEVLGHPLVVVELACGTPPQRQQLLALLGALPAAPVATHSELLALIQHRSLFGRGCGAVDIALLATTLLAEGAALWTHDKRLYTLADELGCAYRVGLDH